MAKKKRRPIAPIAPIEPQSSTGMATPQSRSRWGLIALFFVIAIGGTYMSVWLNPRNAIPEFTYRLIRKVPHDTDAFTQGFLVHDGYFYESTGLAGKSSLRKVEMETGKVLKRLDLDDTLFGEGLARIDGKLVQLTWQNEKGFAYRETEDGFELVDEFSYDHEGWGLAENGSELIVSDGTANLRFWDPETFEELRTIYVRRKDRRVLGQLNELEHFGSAIYANIYNSDKVYRIDAKTGAVEAIIDLSGLWPYSERPTGQSVLNGIAIEPGSEGRMWVTGKLCPFVYEIEIVPK